MSPVTYYAGWLLAVALIGIYHLTRTKKIKEVAPLLWTEEGGD